MNLEDVKSGQRVRVLDNGRLATVLGMTDMWDYELAVHADGETADWPVDANEIELIDKK